MLHDVLFGWMCFYVFLQISYDLKGSLSKNKDALSQNLVFTMKCKYPMKMCTWAYCGVRAHLFPHAAHKSTLCERVIIFVFMCVASHTADGTGSELVVNRCCQMWRDFIGGTQAALVRLPGFSHVQQPNCCNLCDGANLLIAGPSLPLGCSTSLWMRRCVLTVHLRTLTYALYHFYTLNLTAVWKTGHWSQCLSVAAHSEALKGAISDFLFYH